MSDDPTPAPLPAATEAVIARWNTDTARWDIVAGPLPPVDDPALYDDQPEAKRVTYWHLPTTVDIRPQDRLVARERAWVLMDRCGPQHPATLTLARYAEAHYVDGASWAANRQVWACRPIKLDTPG